MGNPYNKFRHALLIAEQEIASEAKAKEEELSFSCAFEERMSPILIRQARLPKKKFHYGRIVASFVAVFVCLSVVFSADLMQPLRAEGTEPGELQMVRSHSADWPIPTLTYYDQFSKNFAPVPPIEEINRKLPYFHSDDTFYVQEEYWYRDEMTKGHKRYSYYLRSDKTTPVMRFDRRPLTGSVGFGFSYEKGQTFFGIKLKHAEINGYTAAYVESSSSWQWIWRDDYFMYRLELGCDWQTGEPDIPMEHALDILENSGTIYEGNFSDYQDEPYYITGRTLKGEYIYEKETD